MCVDVAAYHGFCLLAFGVCIRALISVKSVKGNYGRTAVCAECGDKTRLKSAIGQTGSAQLQCHLPAKAWRSSQQTGKNLYFKEHITIVGLSGITLQI
jgi:hypothetical protein